MPQHDQIAKGGPKIVEVTLEVIEEEIEIAPGVHVQAMTFNGSIPGPMIVVHEGDYVELTLKNPQSNTMAHNIDFHASTGALGGGELTLVVPGQQVKLRWKATKAGTFIYHCAPGGPMLPPYIRSVSLVSMFTSTTTSLKLFCLERPPILRLRASGTVI